jgi:hypothetical protein
MFRDRLALRQSAQCARNADSVCPRVWLVIRMDGAQILQFWAL